MTRINRHLTLACVSIALGALIYLTVDATDTMYLLSMATAYTGLILLAISLLIGPINLLAGKKNPVSGYFRRDIGIWAAIVSLLHVIVGLQVHMAGNYFRYFFYERQPPYSSVRFDAFGIANHSGLVAGIICIVLLALSNNASLKKMGVAKWKNAQRLNYVLFILVVGHGFLYQIVEKHYIPYAGVVGIIMLTVLWYQWKGYKLYSNK